MGKPQHRLFDDEVAAAQSAAGGSELGQNAVPFRLEDFAGIATFRDKPIFNQEQVINQLDTGRKFNTANGTITFGFMDGPTAVGLYNSPKYQREFFVTEGFGFREFNDGQKAAARQTMVLWDDLIAVKIVEKNGNGADILFASDINTQAGFGYYPGEGHKFQGDVWVGAPEVNWVPNWLQYNGFGFTAMVHESGHALGLSHPGAYNGSAAFSYQNYAEYAQDSLQYSIMSYFNIQNTGGLVVNGSILQLGNPQTPLIHDILAIQAKYGADPATRVGDTNYFSNSNAGNGVYDLSQNPYPYLAVYDAGGEDTFDFSTANRSVFIDLRPGSFSSAGLGAPSLELANKLVAEFNAATEAPQPDFTPWTSSAQLESIANQIGAQMVGRVFADTGVAGLFTIGHRNISIAYNTIIENANGGSARDYLVGNHVSNKLSGNAGDDVLNGLGGDDLLTGGSGADEFRFTDGSGNDRIADFVSGSDRISLSEIDANSGTAGDQAFTFIGGAAFSNSAGELRSYSQGGENFLAGDVNGDGLADFTINLGSAAAAVSDFFL
ncbi:MAG TPA: M10 family metallopeptidase C-terminal domain-containing protein [Allosphingosinicella sp.]|jgi:serralysin